MPIIIKEIKVSTTVENKIFIPAEVPDSFYDKLKEEIVEELSARDIQPISKNRMKER